MLEAAVTPVADYETSIYSGVKTCHRHWELQVAGEKCIPQLAGKWLIQCSTKNLLATALFASRLLR